MDWINKYAVLLADYSLYLQPKEKVYVRATTLAEPLVAAFYKEAIKRGAILDIELSFEGQEEILLQYGNEAQLSYVSPSSLESIAKCDAYLFIRAPFDLKDSPPVNSESVKIRTNANAEFSKIYFERLGNGSLKRSLCQFPTLYAAKIADMSLQEYTLFIQKACYLNSNDPKEDWLTLSRFQQRIVDYLNSSKQIHYNHPQFSIRFNVENRIWINSDGKSNMPSGEVFTSPIEDSVEGEIFFDYPTIMKGVELQGIRLKVKNGEIYSWTAHKGQEVLDSIFEIEGTRRFGEAAIGTNSNIQQATKNILFDEKIGGTVHMAIGQSYYQCGGKNVSAIHWDLITDMKNGGEIFADGNLIYKNGEFLI